MEGSAWRVCIQMSTKAFNCRRGEENAMFYTIAHIGVFPFSFVHKMLLTFVSTETACTQIWICDMQNIYTWFQTLVIMKRTYCTYEWCTILSVISLFCYQQLSLKGLRARHSLGAVSSSYVEAFWCKSVWQWASRHNTLTRKLKQLNELQELLISLFTPVLFIPWHVEMCSVKMVSRCYEVFLFCLYFDWIFCTIIFSNTNVLPKLTSGM